MADLRDIVEVKELRDAEKVNELRTSGDWVLLSAAAGTDENGVLGRLYIMGRPYKDPDSSVEWF